MPTVYLDHAATTPPAPAVLDKMTACAREAWSNPSAVYEAAGAARREMRIARRQIAQMLGCDMQELLFTSGGTEANNGALRLAQGKHAVLSAIEHPSVLRAAQEMRCDVTLVEPDARGVIDPQAVAAAIRPETALISVQAANNETGVLQPVVQIGRIARARRVPYHCDAVQAFGHVPLSASDCSLMSISAHKLCGPRGIGALYVRSGVMLPPLLVGGEQEFSLRAGTENVPAIAGFGLAARLAQEDMAARAQRERALMADFLTQLGEGDPVCRVLGADAPRLPGVAAVFFPHVPAHRFLAALDLLGVQASGGAACRMRENAVSPAYRFMGLSQTEAACVLRFSLGRDTAADALHYAAQCVVRVYAELSGCQP